MIGIRRLKVGYRPVTGLTPEARRKRKFPGKVYFGEEWVGQCVVVIPMSMVYRFTTDAIILKQDGCCKDGKEDAMACKGKGKGKGKGR